MATGEMEAGILTALRQASGPLSMAEIVQRTLPPRSMVPDEWTEAVNHLVGAGRVEAISWRACGVVVPGLRLPRFI